VNGSLAHARPRRAPSAAVANRIAKGTFTLDGSEARLATNNGPNHLHGGVKGWDKVFWAARPYDSEDGSAGVEFSYSSADGEEGYPGAVDATADYRLTPDNEVLMSFTAKVEGGATPIAMCNHTYWNLSGQLRRSIKEHHLQLACSHYLPVDATLVPTGEIAPVAGTPFDFTCEKLVGQDLAAVDGGGEAGYDHCLCRAGPGGVPPEGLGLATIAVLRDAESGRKMTVTTTAPGVQLYTGNFLSKDAADAPHVQHNALCLETEEYPDAINRPGIFPSPVLCPGETYRHVAIHKFEW